MTASWIASWNSSGTKARATTTSTETEGTTQTEEDREAGGSKWIDTAGATVYAITPVKDVNSLRKTTERMPRSRTKRVDVPLAAIDG